MKPFMLLRILLATLALVFSVEVSRAQESFDLAPASVSGLAFSPDGKTLAAATGGESSGGGPLVLWEVDATGKDWKRQELVKEPAGCSSVAFSPDGKRLAYGEWKDKAVVLDIETGDVVQTLQLAHPVPGVAFTPDGSGVATACHNKSAYLWDVASGAETRRFEGHEEQVNSVDISPDGTLLLTASDDRTVRLWNLNDGQTVYVSPRGGNVLPDASFSADGRLFAYPTASRYIHVRETASRKLMFFPRAAAQVLGLSPDGGWLATAAHGNTASLFRLDLRQPSGRDLRRIDEQIDEFYGEDYAAREAASAELGKFGLVAEQRLEEAAISKDAEVRIRGRELLRQARSPEEPLRELGDLDGNVLSLCFSPDGKLLAVGSRDGDVKVWSVPQFEEVAHLPATIEGASTAQKP